MKIKDNIDISVLEKYGFSSPGKENGDDWRMLSRFKYIFSIGHSRRGQFYYILVDQERYLNIYASPPDGSGDTVKFPDVILQLIRDNIIE